jgi:heat shock protein HtpX
LLLAGEKIDMIIVGGLNVYPSEVEAVLGHELGHVKHRDVQTMMVVSFLPALFYYLGFSLMWSGNSRNRNEGGNNHCWL